MKQVILSIKPEYTNRIITGEKQFEYRKRIFKDRSITSIIVYASFPICKIIGEFEVGDIIEESPTDLWEQTKECSGITEKDFFKYFSGIDKGFAIQINNFIQYETPKELKEVSCFCAPQSFAYVV